MNTEKTIIRVVLAAILAVSTGFTQTTSISQQTERQRAASGEGLFRPSESAATSPILGALSSVVRVTPRIRFRLSIFATEEEAKAARSRPGARDKDYLPEGGVIWPVLMSRSGLRQLCADKTQAAQPGFYELCEAEKSFQGLLPQTVMTSPLHGSASGFVVGRLDDGDYVVATAYHVAREAIERAHRTAGVHEFRSEPAPDLVVGISRNGKYGTNDYISVSGVKLLANVSQDEWKNGEDWALLSISSKGIPPMRVLPIAKLVPLGERVWVIGFPTRTRRQPPYTAGYQDADDDLRISTGMIVGAAAA